MISAPSFLLMNDDFFAEIRGYQNIFYWQGMFTIAYHCLVLCAYYFNFHVIHHISPYTWCKLAVIHPDQSLKGEKNEGLFYPMERNKIPLVSRKLECWWVIVKLVIFLTSANADINKYIKFTPMLKHFPIKMTLCICTVWDIFARQLNTYLKQKARSRNGTPCSVRLLASRFTSGGLISYQDAIWGVVLAGPITL